MRTSIRSFDRFRRLTATAIVLGVAVGVGLWFVIDRGVAVGPVGADGGLGLALWLAVGLGALIAAMLAMIARVVRGVRQEVELRRAESDFDPLTNLPNRAVFNARLADCVRERRRGEDTAVMVVDLDRFKEVNDTLGHRSGDKLLAEVARRLAMRLRRSDTVAHLGGDEFGILLPAIDGLDGVTKVVEALRATLSAPLVIDDVSLAIEASVGVAMMDEQGHSAETLLRRADRAMQRAKRQHTGYEIYAAEDVDEDRDQLALIGDLRRAIAHGELRLHYQPKANVANRKIRSVEALVRWQHPTRGFMPPDKFIPLAESSGLIRQLTYWVLDEAMRQAREWAEAGHGLKIAVNLSQQSLLDDSIHAEIERVLDRHRVPAKALEIEITESALVSDLGAANAALAKLDEMGIALSIDDYGTGYSSLSHVRGLPVSCIKIDRSFVSGMLVDQKNAAIVRSTIELARDLGISVVAEGVETMEEWDALAELGCHVAQGYLISKPQPGSDLFGWLEGTGHTFRMDAKLEAATPLPSFS